MLTVRTILLTKSQELYLQQCSTGGTAGACGIVIGHEIDSENYVVVHLAKNREDEIDPGFTLLTTNISTSSISGQHPLHADRSLTDINTQAVANQWLGVSKLIPGSFSVLGIFFCAEEVNDSTFRTASHLLFEVQNIVHESTSLNIESDKYGSILLIYSRRDGEIICQSYPNLSNINVTETIKCEFLKEPIDWFMCNCNYFLEEVFPIIESTQKINIEHQFNNTVNAVRENLEASQVLLQNERVKDNIKLEDFLKRNQSEANVKGGYHHHLHNLHATIILPTRCQVNSDGHAVKVRHFSGSIRFAGYISSRIYCCPQNTLGDIKRFIRRDVIRSLVARIQVYCDGLTETTITNEAIFISEPPRRVYFYLNKTDPIQFSEYVFRDETIAMALAQAKQILDLDINGKHIIDDVEALPDDETFSDISASFSSPMLTQISSTMRYLNNTMYMLGILVSLLVLLLSACLHYFFKTDDFPSTTATTTKTTTNEN